MKSIYKETDHMARSMEVAEIREEIHNGIPDRVSSLEEVTEFSKGGYSRTEKEVRFSHKDDDGDFVFVDENGLNHTVSKECFPYHEWKTNPSTKKISKFK